jgi:predicted RNase H-like nuclease (RuvC/YqgF family)
MAGQERLSVDAAAQRLGISPDAVRSRIKRGTLWAVRRNGRVQVVLHDPVARETVGARFAGRHLPTQGATQDATQGTTQDVSSEDTVTRLRAEIAHQKHRVRELERERERLERELARQRQFVDLEYALRARLQDQLDRLNERLADALPEILDDPTERADRLWKRLGRQVERLGRDSEPRDS